MITFLSSSFLSPQFSIHSLPPLWPKPPHSPDNHTAARCDNPNTREKPAVPDRTYERLRDHCSPAREDIPHEIVERDAVRRFPWHELGQHGRRHGENEHGTDAKEEIGHQGDEPEDALLRRPAVPDQRGRVEEGCDPGVFAHAIFGPVH